MLPFSFGIFFFCVSFSFLCVFNVLSEVFPLVIDFRLSAKSLKKREQPGESEAGDRWSKNGTEN